MVSKKILLNLTITLFILVAIIHTILQFSIYGTGIPGFYESGISGFSIGKFAIGEEFRKEHTSLSNPSKIILIAEWAFILCLIIISLIKGKAEQKKELETLKLKEKHSSKNKTDLDTLYDLLKEKEHLSIKTIAKIFNVKKEIAKNWCETLESGNLATLRYPRIGDPELVINK
jgi:hypothetical protein